MRLQVGIDPVTVFSISDMDQLRKVHWKERVKISKIAKFESDLLKTKEDTALKSRENLQTFVRWGRRHHRGQTSKSLFLFLIARISFTS